MTMTERRGATARKGHVLRPQKQRASGLERDLTASSSICQCPGGDSVAGRCDLILNIHTHIPANGAIEHIENTTLQNVLHMQCLWTKAASSYHCRYLHVVEVYWVN